MTAMATSGTAAKMFIHAERIYENVDVNGGLPGIVFSHGSHLDLDEVTERLEAREARRSKC